MEMVIKGRDVLPNDFHTHSVQSLCGMLTVMEILRVAASKGTRIVNICDHGMEAGKKMNFGVIGNPLRTPDVVEFHDSRCSAPIHVSLLAGIEANILDDGSCDLPSGTLKSSSHKFKLVSAGFHSYAKELKAMRNPYANFEALQTYVSNNPLDILTHPCIDTFPFPIDDLIQLALEYDFALEVNNTNLVVSKTNVPLLREMIEKAHNAGVDLVCNSDGHTWYELNECGAVRALVEGEMGMNMADVFPLNFCSPDNPALVGFIRGTN